MESAHRFAKAGDLDGLRQLIDSAPDALAAVNEVDKHGYSPLYYAIARSAPIEVIEALLDAGADHRFARVTQTGVFPEGPLGAAAEALFNQLGGQGRAEHREPILSAALRRGDV